VHKTAAALIDLLLDVGWSFVRYPASSIAGNSMNDFHYKRRYHGPLKAVVLDWAGTTVDFGSRAPVLAVMEAFRRLDVPVTVEQARGPMGMAKRDHLRVMLDMPEVSAGWRKVHGRAPGSDDVDRLYQQFLPVQKEILAANSQLIPGCLDAISHCRSCGISIGSSTGYTQELMDIIVPLVHAQGYRPDAIVCASDVSPGRPAPWMCFENARRLGVYPMEAIVKVDDTTVGIEAGLNAGMWTVGITRSGNLVGLSEDELNRLPTEEQNQRVAAAAAELYQAGAHLAIDTIAELPIALEQIGEHVARGERP
jgi:phosphonoacetaldehyde hydrolase